MANSGTVERAFELARSGSCHKITDICKRLKLEGHDSIDLHLSGHSIRKQLVGLMQS